MGSGNYYASSPLVLFAEAANTGGVGSEHYLRSVKRVHVAPAMGRHATDRAYPRAQQSQQSGQQRQQHPGQQRSRSSGSSNRDDGKGDDPIEYLMGERVSAARVYHHHPRHGTSAYATTSKERS